MRAVSLFSGVGGFELGLEAAGIDTVVSVEIDDQARGVLELQFPNTKLFTDVQEVAGAQLISAGWNPADGILVGGFPCQDLSVAGRRAGLEGLRSGLFWEFHRILEETKPKWFILENVPGLLSSNGGRDMGTVLGALVDVGYGVSYRVLDAQFFGVPQRRRRVFIVGCFGDDGSASAEVLAVGDSGAGDFEQVAASGKEASASVGGSTAVVHRMLGFGHYAVDGTFSTLKARGYKDVTDIVTFVKSKRAQNVDDFESWREAFVAPTVNGFDVRASRETTIVVEPEVMVRRLTPVEFERLQGFSPHWTRYRYDFKKERIVEQADSSRYKQMGNAVAVPVVTWIAERINTREEFDSQLESV